jgi:hypothetical protein
MPSGSTHSAILYNVKDSEYVSAEAYYSTLPTFGNGTAQLTISIYKTHEVLATYSFTIN